MCPTAAAYITGKSCDILELLLSKGANVNQQSVQGKKKMTSALHVACRNVNLPSVEFLVRNGANLELVEGSGQTALHVATAHDVTGECALLHDIVQLCMYVRVQVVTVQIVLHVTDVHNVTCTLCCTRHY